MQLKNRDSDIAPPFAPLKGIPIWDGSTSLSVQFTCIYYNSNDRVESLFCRQQGGVQAPRTQLFEIGLSILFFFFFFFFFAGDIYS
ncbi:hypothetical protein ACN42_g5494 [Penicillium freii]|uniref:Uncharacterized protein n=1 Tax=Penicillium freii TaxID=48697 RepID=A0A101MJC3_PENFR|nr:hypothetical protein ACN42_g5494 [Penicillium freii]